MVDWKELWRKNNNGFLVDRVEGRFSYTRTDYRLDRYLMRGTLVLSLLVVAVALGYGLIHGVKLHEFYFSCPIEESGGCPNPFYLVCDQGKATSAGMPADWCEQVVFVDHFRSGTTIGTPPNEAFIHVQKWASIIAVLVFVAGLVLNHCLYNWGKAPFKIEDSDEAD